MCFKILRKAHNHELQVDLVSIFLVSNSVYFIFSNVQHVHQILSVLCVYKRTYKYHNFSCFHFSQLIFQSWKNYSQSLDYLRPKSNIEISTKSFTRLGFDTNFESLSVELESGFFGELFYILKIFLARSAKRPSHISARKCLTAL